MAQGILVDSQELITSGVVQMQDESERVNPFAPPKQDFRFTVTWKQTRLMWAARIAPVTD